MKRTRTAIRAFFKEAKGKRVTTHNQCYPGICTYSGQCLGFRNRTGRCPQWALDVNRVEYHPQEAKS